MVRKEDYWEEMMGLLDSFFSQRKQIVEEMGQETGKEEILQMLSVEESETLQRVEKLLNEIELEEILKSARKEPEENPRQSHFQGSPQSHAGQETFYRPPAFYPWRYGYYGQSGGSYPLPPRQEYEGQPYPPSDSRQAYDTSYPQGYPYGYTPEAFQHNYAPYPHPPEQKEPPVTAAQPAAAADAAVGQTNKAAHVVTNIIFYLVIIVVILGSAMFALSQNTGKNILGYRFYNVLTASMSPKLNVGDLIFVKVTDPSEIEEGDVITYNPTADKDTYLTHQVEQKIDNYEDSGISAFRTKGIANDTPDPYTVTDDMLIGKVVVAVPNGGTVMSYVRDNIWIIVILIVMISVLCVLIRRIFSKNFTLVGTGKLPADTPSSQQPGMPS